MVDMDKENDAGYGTISISNSSNNDNSDSNNTKDNGNHDEKGKLLLTTQAAAQNPLMLQRQSSTQIYLTFLDEFLKADGGWQIILIGMLTALGIGSVIGIIPQVATQRYAEELYEYGSNEELCNSFLTDEGKPDACIVGAAHAQSAASVCALVRNGLLLLCNPVAGSYSDTRGRRGPQIFCLASLVVSPAALLVIQVYTGVNPSWYFALDGLTSIVSFFSVAYSQLSDIMPAKHRAASFGLYFGAFFGGIGLAPFFAVFFETHVQVTTFSLLVRVVALLFAIVALPETLPPAVSARNKERQLEKISSSVVDDYRSAMSRSFNILVTIMLRPIKEMWILGRNEILVLLTVGAFLSKLVLSADITLFFYYVETELGVRDTDVARMMLVIGVLGVLIQAVFLKYFISLLGERGLLIASYITGILHNLIYGLARDKSILYIGLCLSQLSNMSGPLLSSLASRNVDESEQGRMQGALFALAALAEGIGPLCFNFVYRNWHSFGPGTMFVVAAMLYCLGTVAIVLIPTKPKGSNSDGDDNKNRVEESLA